MILAMLACACPLRAGVSLPSVYAPPAPQGHSYIIGMAAAKNRFMLLTVNEVWEAAFSEPTSFIKVFDPTLSGVRMFEGSVGFYDADADLYYFAGGLFDFRIYEYQRSTQSVIAQGGLLNLSAIPGGISVNDGWLYATSPGAVNVYSVTPLHDQNPSTQYGVGLLQNPQAVALDEASSSLYVLDTGQQKIFQFALAADPEDGGDLLSSIDLVDAAAGSALQYDRGRLFVRDAVGGGIVYDAATGAQLASFHTSEQYISPFPTSGGKPVLLVSPDGNTLYAWDNYTDNRGYDLTSILPAGPIYQTGEGATLSTFSSPGVVSIQGAGGSLTLTGMGSEAELINVYAGNELIISPTASVETDVLRVIGGTAAARVTIQGDESSRGVLSIGEIRNSLGPAAGSLNFDGGILRAAQDLQFSAPVTLQPSGGFLDTNGREMAITGPISGEGGLTKWGQGTLVLTGQNTFTGGVVLDSGTLGLGSNQALGAGTLTINGGGIRAVNAERTLTNAVILNGDFTLGRLTNFTGPVTLNADITITSANPDTGASATSTLSGVISGNHSLTFTAGANPIGAIVLNGANTYTGGTIVDAGRLRVGHDSALGSGAVRVQGGVLEVQEGFTIGNAVILAGGTYERRLAGSLAHAVDATSDFGVVNTSAMIVSGSTTLTTLTTSFSPRSAETLSDIYSFQGTGSNLFVLQLSFAAIAPDSYLGWRSGDEWLNAREGNTGNNPLFADPFSGSFAAFQSIHGMDLSAYVGAWGVEVSGGVTSTWAVLNHNSDFAVLAVPEPGTATLLMAAFLAAGMLWFRRNRQGSKV